MCNVQVTANEQEAESRNHLFCSMPNQGTGR